MKLAPIALFVYNRPEHTRRTLESLQKNELAERSDLFVFADGSKNGAATSAVEEVRKLLRSIEGFQSVTIVERDKNFGLSNPIISGVTQLCGGDEPAIVVEDALMT